MEAYNLFNQFLDGVFIFDENKNIVYCNEIAGTIFGTRSKRTLGKKTFEEFKIQNDTLFCSAAGTEGKDFPSQYVEVAYTGKNTQGLVQIMVEPCPIYPELKHYLCYFHNVTEEQTLSSKYREESDAKAKAQDKIFKIQDDLKEFTDMAMSDAMTGLKNFRCFTMEIVAELNNSLKYEQPLGLVIIDVDKFKKFNDTYGHQQGDEVLKVVAATLKNSVRKADFIGRYGGEEFVAILPKTDLEGITMVCEKMRAAIEAALVPNINDGHGTLSVTASFGAVMIGPEFLKEHMGKEYKFFLEYSDKNLYEAKEGGRNKCVVSKL
jgi:diguanylate cyclase (GGDEF)-like protein